MLVPSPLRHAFSFRRARHHYPSLVQAQSLQAEGVEQHVAGRFPLGSTAHAPIHFHSQSHLCFCFTSPSPHSHRHSVARTNGRCRLPRQNLHDFPRNLANVHRRSSSSRHRPRNASHCVFLFTIRHRCFNAPSEAWRLPNFPAIIVLHTLAQTCRRLCVHNQAKSSSEKQTTASTSSVSPHGASLLRQPNLAAPRNSIAQAPSQGQYFSARY